MAKTPAERFETCDLFCKALAAALGPDPSAISKRGAVDAPDPSPSSGTAAARPTTERKPWRVLLGGVGVVIISALLVRAFLKNREQPVAEVVASSSAVDRETTTPPPKKQPVPQRAHPALDDARSLPSALSTASAAVAPSPSASAPAAASSQPAP